MTFLRKAVLAVCAFFSLHAVSYADIVADGAYMNWSASHLSATCIVKQTSSYDYVLFPGGKGYTCTVNGNFLAQDGMCSTNHGGVHWCSSTPSTSISSGPQVFRNQVFGHNGSDWEFRGEKGNSWNCTGYPGSMSCAFVGAW